MRLHFDPVKILKAKLIRNVRRPHFDYDDVVRGEVWACTDLDAFPQPLPRLKGIRGIVIMEDRDPEFYLSFRHYQPWAETNLNRHGPLHKWHTQQDLKELVKALHEQKIKVAIGFWNYAGMAYGTLSQASFFRAHPEIVRTPGSSDMHPFTQLVKEGIAYSDYIAHQYQKLQETFHFDGLMFGDGFCGFRSYNPNRYRDQEEAIPQWTEFYATIARTIHNAKGILLAYDCQGFSYSEAQRHGVDYKDLSKAGLDMLVYQSYPQAWAEYWFSAYKDKFDLDSNVINLRTVKKALAGTGTKVLYTLELGDSVEKWWADQEKTRKQVERLDPLADGRFLVWANDLFAGLEPYTKSAG